MTKSFIFFFFLAGLWLEIGAATLEVCHTCELADLELAVESAQEGDTILIRAGVYRCVNLNIAKRLTILGESGATLDGQKEGYLLKVFADSVSIKGLKFINSGRSYTKDFAAIYAFKVDHFRIVENEIEDPFFGLLIEKSKNGLIANNTISGHTLKEDDAGNGIHLWHCRNIEITDNEVFGMRDGLYLEFVDSSRVTRNYAHDNVRYGLHFMFSNHDEYVENIFRENGAGVAVMFSKFIRMINNRFVNNWGAASYGLLLKEIYDAEVRENAFVENTTAIFIDGTTRINYANNLFRQNGWAIKVSGGCYANHLFNNNFIGNTFDVSYHSKLNDNTFTGNYWADYAGYDLDRDGIGDVPHRPVKLFSYIVNQTPETIVLMRSLFIDIINFSERVSPIFTPDNLIDTSPAIRPFP